MKKIYTLSLAAVICVLISSCSNTRYGSISKVKMDSKVEAKADKKEKSKEVIIQAENNVIENNAVETNSVTVKIEDEKAVNSIATLTPKSNFIFKKKQSLQNENKVVANEITKNAAKSQLSAPTKQAEVKQLTLVNKVKNTLIDNTLLIIIAFFIPFLAVGLASDWTDTSAILINLLLTLLCWLPGFIHAIVYIGKNNNS